MHKNIMPILMLPILFYPCYMFSQVLMDVLVGDILFFDQFIFFSKHKLVIDFFSDWVVSLQFIYPIFFMLLIFSEVLAVRSILSRRAFFLLASVLSSLFLAWFFSSIMLLLVLFISCLIYFSISLWVLGRRHA